MVEELKPNTAPDMGATAGVGGATPSSNSSPVLCVYLINGLYSYAANKFSDYSIRLKESEKISEEYIIKKIMEIADQYIDEYEKYQSLIILSEGAWMEGREDLAKRYIKNGRSRLDRATKIAEEKIYEQLPTIWHEICQDVYIHIALADGRAYKIYLYDRKVDKEQWQVVEVR